MSKIYSETFLRITLAGTIIGYTVPAGHRAVVRSVLAVQGGTLPGQALIWIAGVNTCTIPLPGTYKTENVDCRAVAYAGQKIEGYSTASGINLTISGYLFEDVTGATRAPGELSAERAADPRAREA